MLGPDGTPVQPPIEGGGLNRPLGVAVDSSGHAWVSSSGMLPLPCAPVTGTPSGEGGAVLINPNGELARPLPFTGAGITLPWGIAVDGNDNVWIANNWKNLPVQTNPGGHQVVVFLGLAAPIKTPLIGPPQRP